MREYKEKWYIKLLKWLGVIKEKEIDNEESDRLKAQMCIKAIQSGVCPDTCSICAWNTGKE